MEQVRYLDFDIRIIRQSRNRYIVHVRSPAGEASSEFRLPLTAAQRENLVLKLTRNKSATRRIDSPELLSARDLGGKLFKAVFCGSVRDCFRSSFDKARQSGNGLRLKLRLQEAPDLADLPWEFLFDPDTDRFLARSIYTPIVRYLELPESVPAVTTTLPLRILCIVSSPTDYQQLNVKREHKLMKDALAQLIDAGQAEIVWLEKATFPQLHATLRDGDYHILHFIGHGGFDPRMQRGVLVFEDDTGRSCWVDAERLAALLHDHRTLRLAVLNACEGARSSVEDPFAGVAATLVQQGIPAVAAMQFEISDEAAIVFAREFYTDLARGFPVDMSVAEARKAIFSTLNEVEWGTPVLFLRTETGALFDFQPQIQKGSSAEVTKPNHQEGDRPATPPARLAGIPVDGTYEPASVSPNPPWDNSPDETSLATEQLNEKLQKQLSELWRSALTSFYSRDWDKAIRDFQAVVRLDSSYKDATVKLAKALREKHLAKLYTEAQEARNAGKLAKAADKLQQLLADEKGYKDAAALLEDVHKSMLLATHYDDAQTLASTEQWRAVLDVFDEIAALDPQYPDPEQLLATAHAKIAEQERQQELENLLAQSFECFEAEDWRGAELRLSRIQELEPDYMDSKQLLLRARAELASSSRDSLEEGTVNEASGVSDPEAYLLLHTLEGHTNSICSVAFSPDSKLSTTGSDDATVRLWNATTGEHLRTLQGHATAVRTVAFSPDGLAIASGSNDRTVRLWDAVTGEHLRTLIGHTDFVRSLAFRHDGKVIATGSDDKTVRLWNVETGVQLFVLEGHKGWVYGVNSVAFSPDGKVIASAGTDATVRLWNAETGEHIRTIKGHTSSVRSLAFSPDGTLIATGGDNAAVRLWNAESGTALRTLKGQAGYINSLVFSPDGKVIATGSDDTTVRLWNVEPGVRLRTLAGHTANIRAVAFSPDGKLFASGSDDRTVRLWVVNGE